MSGSHSGFAAHEASAKLGVKESLSDKFTSSTLTFSATCFCFLSNLSKNNDWLTIYHEYLW